MELSELLASQEPAEIAHLLESLPDIRRSSLWTQVPDDVKGEVLSHMGEVALLSLVDSIDHEDVVNAAADLEARELAGVIETMPDDIGEAIRESLDYRGLRELDATLAFPEDSAGRLMHTEAVSVRADVVLETVLRYLRFRESLPDHTAGLMVVDREGHFLGELPLSMLLTCQPDVLVSDVMNPDAVRIRPEVEQRELAILFRDHDLVSVAVVDEDEKLIGRVTIDDIVDIIQDEADRQILGAAGLDAEHDNHAAGCSSLWRVHTLSNGKNRY